MAVEHLLNWKRNALMEEPGQEDCRVEAAEEEQFWLRGGTATEHATVLQDKASRLWLQCSWLLEQVQAAEERNASMMKPKKHVELLEEICPTSDGIVEQDSFALLSSHPARVL